MKHYIAPSNPMHSQFAPQAAYVATHFAYTFHSAVATITLNRPERKNPLTFASYAELRDLFNALRYATDVKAVVLAGAGGNFLQRRRCARDHWPIDHHADARAAGVHPHDGRLG